MLEILGIDFNDQDQNWSPDDVFDFEEWVTVNVGEDDAGNYYQFCLCTNSSVSRIDDKRHIFIIERWKNIEDLIEKLNKFIKEKLESNLKDDPYRCLSKYWIWEYERYKS